MNGYKKIIKSQKVRMTILKMLSFIPDKQMIIFQYWIKLRRIVDLKSPARYTEKLQWYKLYYRNSLMEKCVDKYRVREYVEEKGLSNILVKLYSSYNNVAEIEYEKLPAKFIIKTTNGSGTNIICNQKSNFDWENAKKKISEYMNRPIISPGREWAYYGVKNRIIVEELLEDKNNPYGGINDYKFMCFNGKPECVVVDVGRITNHKRNFYDMEWKRIQVSSDHDNFEYDIEKPRNFEKMIVIAETLAESFPHVRVDLYNIEGKIYFGEMTFYPWSGYVEYVPDSFDFDLGKKFVLPEDIK